MAKHYHVMSGMGGGYTPNRVDTFSSRRAAERYAADTAREWEDQEYQHDDPADRRAKSGSARSGGYVFQRDDPYDLGEYINIDGPCHETECEEDDDA